MSRSRPSPSHDRPVATHNAKEPTPPAFRWQIWGVGEVCPVSSSESPNHPGNVTQRPPPIAGVHGGYVGRLSTQAWTAEGAVYLLFMHRERNSSSYCCA